MVNECQVNDFPWSHCIWLEILIRLKILNIASIILTEALCTIGSASGYLDAIHIAVKMRRCPSVVTSKGTQASIFISLNTS